MSRIICVDLMAVPRLVGQNVSQPSRSLSENLMRSSMARMPATSREYTWAAVT